MGLIFHYLTPLINPDDDVYFCCGSGNKSMGHYGTRLKLILE